MNQSMNKLSMLNFSTLCL